MKELGTKRLLFVDDEPPILLLLQAVCRKVWPEWECATANDASGALELMGETPFDAVISDMRMPGMTGAELLNVVREKHPQTKRIILSGFADQETLRRCLGATHQYLSKPMDIKVLKSTLHRLMELDQFVNSDRFKVIAGRIQSLPTLPAQYYRLMEELSSPDATADSVAELISRDPSLTAKLLQLTNSAFLGVAQPVMSAKEAVQILGFSTIKSLSQSIYVFSRFDAASLPGLALDRLWRHSMATGMFARQIAAGEHLAPAEVELAITGGVLHDIGRLVLGYALPALSAQATQRAESMGLPHFQTESEAIGVSHPQVGGYLLGLWGLPPSLVDVVANHHSPRNQVSRELDAMICVHLAEHVQSRLSPSGEVAVPSPLDEEYLASLPSPPRLEFWTSAQALE